MTLEKALELVSENLVEFTKNNFQTCTSWHFEYEGVEYRLCEWAGLLVKVETVRLPRTCLSVFYFTPEAETLYGHLHKVIQ